METSSKRQGVMIGLMVLALLYGAYEFFFAAGRGRAPGPTPPPQAQELDLFKENILAQRPGPASAVETGVIAAAETPWIRDPFMAHAHYLAWNVASQAPKDLDKPVHFDYTGFVDFGDNRLAVINELDYEVGDMVLHHDYQVIGIAPDKVILEHVVDGTLLDVLIQEMETLGGR